MTLLCGWRQLDGGPIEVIDGRIRLNSVTTTVNAEEGSSGSWTVEIDDPDGDFDIVGHRCFVVWETDAPAGNQVIAVGYTQRRRVKHGDQSNLTETARVWEVDVWDLNTVLGRRIMTGSDCKRPAETDVARMQWAVLTNEAGLIDDDTYLSTAGPVDMDAADYTGQTLLQVIQDCAEASGKNYFLWWTGSPLPFGEYSIFYDFTESAVWTSDLRLSSNPNLIDQDSGGDVFACTAVLERAPDRVSSGAFLPYDGGYVYRQDTGTVADFARIDRSFPSVSVKSKAKATARADRYLAEFDDEEDRLSIAYECSALDINRLHAGQRVSIQFPHLPGYEVNRWARMLTRTVTNLGYREDGLNWYRVEGDLSPTPISLDDTDYGGGGGGGTLLGTLMVDIPIGNPTNGNNSEAEYGNDLTGPGTLNLYDGCTYQAVMSVIHGTTGSCSGGTLRLSIQGSQYVSGMAPDGAGRYNFGSECDGNALGGGTTVIRGERHSYDPEPISATLAFVTHCCGWNGITSSAEVAVYYLSGPDPRFP